MLTFSGDLASSRKNSESALRIRDRPCCPWPLRIAIVELIGLTEPDLAPLVAAQSARELDDLFAAIIHHLDQASSHVERAYELDKRGALTKSVDWWRKGLSKWEQL
jgi:hypothetical protein